MIKKLFLFLIILTAAVSVFSDEREENIDIYILLDKSLSMENNIEEVKKYINSFIIDNIIISGDRLLIINFYGKTEKYIDSPVENNDVKISLKNKLSSVKADGRFTDIGSALDKLSETAGPENSRLKYMLLITDGKQEAPPGTKYYSPDGTFNHELLKHTKTIQKKGWKIEVLGIGKLNKAADIAEKLSGTYVEVEKADASDLAEKTSDLLTIISVKTDPVFKKLNRNNESELSFTAVSSNTDNETEIVIDSVKFTSGNTVYEMLESPHKINISPETDNEVVIPVKINSKLNPGLINGTVEFFYSSEKILTPSLFEAEIEKSAGLNTSVLFIVLAVILVLLILLLIIRRMLSGKEEDRGFDIFLDNEKLSEIPFKLKNNEKLFLIINSAGEFSLSRIKSAFAKAYIVKNGSRINFQILDKKLFPDLKDKMDNILGKSVNIKMKSGKLLKLLFKRK